MMTTNIQKWGNSQGLRIPKLLLDSLNWSENELVEMILKDDEIILRSARAKKPTIEELFSGYEGNAETVEIDWGCPEGKEVW